MGEDEHLALQARVATQEAELRQLQRQQQQLQAEAHQAAAQIRDTEIAITGRSNGRWLTLQQDIEQLTRGELIRLS
jgi:chromosome segregation protein